MIDNGVQSCLAYGIQVSMSNRLYECTTKLKCIFNMLCVMLYNKIYIKGVVLLRGLLCDLVIYSIHFSMNSRFFFFNLGDVLS